MGDFIVSARKYRPATFASVVGQETIATTLKNAVMQDQVAQAFLFCGPRGVGKTTCARILAKTINCTNRTPEGEACNECESCRSFNESASFNIFELDAASNNSVDDIRSLVEQVRIPPQGAKYKVYIIDEVHMLSQAAFNAFLKTLEEPPAYAKFILATTEKHKILPTILSRCQVFDFKRIRTEDITRHLIYVAQQEQVSFEEEALRVIARKADGGLRDALSIFDQTVIFTSGNITYQKVIENLNVLDFEYYLKMTGALYEGDVTRALLTFDEIIDKGFDGQHFLDGMCEHLRNLMVCRTPETIRLLEASEQVRQQYSEQVQKIDAGFLLSCLEMFSRCNNSYKTANNRRLHIELALLLSCRLKEKSAAAPAAPAPAAPTRPTPAPTPQTPPARMMPQRPQTRHTQTAATATAAGTTATKTATGTTSIKDLMKELQSGEKQPAATDTKPAEAGAAANPTVEVGAEATPAAMDPETAAYTLRNRWEEIIRTHCGNNLAAASLLMDMKSISIQGQTITISVANDVAERNIHDALPTLKPALQALTGLNYQFDFVQTESVHTAKIINPEEKFKKLCEINPELKAFKETLGLAIT
jgi:DNA polymerase-3 subunit gamma/tau